MACCDPHICSLTEGPDRECIYIFETVQKYNVSGIAIQADSGMG